MASRNMNIQDSWTMEPELADHPPRRVTKSDQPNPNQPKTVVLFGVSGVALLAGVFLLILGLASNPPQPLFAALGGVLALGGAGLAVMVPQMTSRYFARAERLATHGLPMMARIVSADNMGGDNQYMRLVRYQVPMPNGELMHKQVYADDRRLPVQIPGNATALVDLENNDAELYCALPFIVVAKPGAAPRPTPGDPFADVPPTPATPVAVPTSMNTLNVEGIHTARPGKTPAATPAATPTTPATAQAPSDIDAVLGMDMVAPAKPAQALAQLDAAAPARLKAPSNEALEGTEPTTPLASVAPSTVEVEEPAPVAPALVEMKPIGEAPKDETPEEPAEAPKKPAKPSNSGLPWE